MRTRILIIAALILNTLVGFSQDKDLDKKMKKMLGVKEIEWDHYNEDGVFKARSKNSGKWGMYQYFYEGKRPKTLVPMKYDSLGFYDHSSNFTIVKNKGKYGLLSSPWGDHSELIVRCMYQQLKYAEGYSGLIAAKGNNLWAYIDTETGDTLIPFVHNSYADLPKPSSYFYKYPMREYPEKLMKIIENPGAVTEIDLSRLNLTYLPNIIGKCINATSANLEGNKLTRLPDSFFKLPNLEKLYMGSNPGLLNIDERFAKLKKLRVLFIGALKGYGSNTYSRDSYEFSDELAKMQSLQVLAFHGNFNSSGDIPSFVYELSNLKELDLEGLFGYEYDKMDLQKLKCKDSLEILSIETLESFDNMNASMKYFPNLKKVYIKTYKHKTKPLWISDLPSLHRISITFYYPSKTQEGYYDGGTAVSKSGDYYGKKALTNEERKEALEQWDEFMKKVEE